MSVFPEAWAPWTTQEELYCHITGSVEVPRMVWMLFRSGTVGYQAYQWSTPISFKEDRSILEKKLPLAYTMAFRPASCTAVQNVSAMATSCAPERSSYSSRS